MMKQKWTVLMIVCVGVFMSTLDGSILNIANPTIAAAFQINMSQVQWVVTAYMLVVTATMLFFGKLGDRFGSNYLFTIGFLIFTIGSILCSISNSISTLIASRIFQAVGSSILMATGLGLVSNAFPKNEKGKAIGIIGSVVGVGNMSGPAVGGLLLEQFNWQMIFIINIPIGIIGFLFAVKCLPKQPLNDKSNGFDILGLLLFACCTTLTLLSINQQNQSMWYLASAAFVILIVFILWEKRCKNSFIEMQLFKIKAFTMGNIVGIACYFPQMSVAFLLPFYLEQFKHLTPAMAGLVMTVHPLFMVIIAPLSGSLSDRFGAKMILMFSFFTMTVSLCGLALLKAETSIGILILCLVFFGIGVGSFSSPNNSSILSEIPPNQQGYGGSFLATVRNLSFALSTAFFSSFFSQMLISGEAKTDHSTAYVMASNFSYWIAAAFCLIGFILTMIYMDRSKREIS